MIEQEKNTLGHLLKEKIFNNIITVDENDVIELAALFIEKKYGSNENLVTSGEKWDKVFFIRKGILRVFYSSLEGQEYNKGFFGEGQLLWPVAPSVRKTVSLFSVATLENTTISVCDFSKFYSWLNHYGYWEKFALFYTEAFLEDKFRREYEFLTNSATERFKDFCSEYPDLARRIPDYQLASYLGVTNVTLSRIKKKMDFNLC